MSKKPPLVLTNALIFASTALITLVLVPLYGLEHGYGAALWISFVLVLGANGMAITAGYHRLWSHKAYEAHPILKVSYLLFGTMALQNSVLNWCSGHRKHHLKVDDDKHDPYSAGRGFWFSHIGWMLRSYPSGIEDLANVQDLKADPMLAFQHRHYGLLATIANLLIPFVIGAMLGNIVGAMLLVGVARLCVSHHVTFFINSLAHRWGTRPYTDSNSARDNPLLALMTYGEGYHNFHHIFAHDYRNGVRWWQWDPTKWLIAACAWVGLARRLKRTSGFQIQRALLAMQLKCVREHLAGLAPGAPNASYIESLREKIAHEYAFMASAVSDWTHIKEQWLEKKKRAMVAKWEHTNFQRRLSELEKRIKNQRHRVDLLQAQLGP